MKRLYSRTNLLTKKVMLYQTKQGDVISNKTIENDEISNKKLLLDSVKKITH